VQDAVATNIGQPLPTSVSAEIAVTAREYRLARVRRIHKVVS
jgi:hypothetical protein